MSSAAISPASHALYRAGCAHEALRKQYISEATAIARLVAEARTLAAAGNCGSSAERIAGLALLLVEKKEAAR